MPSYEEDDDDEQLTNVGDYKHGSIRRVKLKNFLTYADVDFIPGPRLNMVIGPNGTGKSTLLCAICLGLGGEPRLLGRASEIGTFVANGEEVGEIEVEVVNQEEGGENPVFRRVITRAGNKSQFFWDGKSISGKKVREACLKTYNISVDNLCTFLPQDRVGSFSGFDAKQLLIETEKASSSSQDLYHTHMELVKAQEELKGGNSKVENMQEKLDQMKKEHSRLEREKMRMEERQIALEQAELFKKKIAWLKFDKKRDETLQKKAESAEAKQKATEKAAEVEPLQQQHEDAAAKHKKVSKEYAAMEKEIRQFKNEIGNQTKKFENHDDQVEMTLQEIQSIDAQRNLLEDKARQSKENFEKMTEEMEGQPTLDSLEKEAKDAKRELRSSQLEYDAEKRIYDEKAESEREAKSQLKRIEQKWAKLQDEKMQRRNHIFRSQPNLQKIYEWIKGNRQIFRKEVIGPIACEINSKSQRDAAYLEQHLPNAVLKTFIVQDKDDYDLLYRKIREELKIPINIALTEQIKQPRPRIHSDAKMKILKEQHGVEGYMDESFTAPDVVIETLRAYGIEKVLIGTEETQKSLDDRNLLDYLVQPEDGSGNLKSSCIFAAKRHDSYRYMSQISRYSGKKNTSIDFVKPAKLLAPGVSEEEKSQVKRELDDLKKTHQACAEEKDAASIKAVELEQQTQRVSKRLKEAQKNVQALRKIVSKLKSAERKWKESEAALAKDDNEEKQRKISHLKNRIHHSLSALEAQAKSYNKMMQITVRCSGMRLNREVLRSEEERLRGEYTDADAEYKKLVREYQNLNQEYKRAKNDLKALKQEADEFAPLEDENGEDLPLRAELDALPFETLDEAEDALEEANRKADSIISDPNVIRQYEQLEQQIEDLQAQVDNLTSTREQQINALKQKVKPWETRLTNQVAKIDARFSVYMQELGCTGEVALNPGNPEEGAEHGLFKDWGIEIRVSFREGVKPQVLSARVQSGGERSVSTIMYLMAMQDMMVSPFRCVDEINQGLDERNERLVFRRIVNNSTEEPGPRGPTDHSGQYFLITPKLLPNLTDMEVEAIKVHCIYNGPYNFKSTLDWDVPKMTALRKRSADEVSEDDEENDENSLNANVEGRVPKRAKGVPKTG